MPQGARISPVIEEEWKIGTIASLVDNLKQNKLFSLLKGNLVLQLTFRQSPVIEEPSTPELQGGVLKRTFATLSKSSDSDSDCELIYSNVQAAPGLQTGEEVVAARAYSIYQYIGSIYSLLHSFDRTIDEESQGHHGPGSGPWR